LWSTTLVGGPQSKALAAYAGTGDYISYLLIGGIVLSTSHKAIRTAADSLKLEMTLGTLESCWMSPIHRYTLFTGRIIMSLSYEAMADFTKVAMVWVIFRPIWNVSLPSLIIILCLTIVCNYSLGMLLAGVVLAFKRAGLLQTLISSTIHFFSAAIFPIALLPSWCQVVSGLIPYTYIIRTLRASILLGVPIDMLYIDLAILSVMTAIFLLSSYLTFRVLERRARRKGVLGFY